MLTENQKKYLEKLPKEKAEKIIVDSPYNPRTKPIAERLLTLIKETLFEADVRYMGASALGISGQNDVDIYIICPSYRKALYRSRLNDSFFKIFGEEWSWKEGETEISVYLSDPDDKNLKEQIEIFEIFTHNPKALREYERVKQSMSGKTYMEYQTAKYEFYNRMLGINQQHP